MEDFKIIKIEKYNNNDGASIYLHDIKKDFSFWVDCCLIDGYGNRKDFKTNELYLDWDFNQYIFNLYNSIDIKAKKYQEAPENSENIQYFLDENNDKIVNIIKGEC